MCVIALRDVYGVATPDSLTYKAWRDPEPPRALWPDDDTDDTDEFDFSAEPLDPGQNPLPLPGLGLARE